MKGKLFEQIYSVAARIPKGRVVTYGEIAKMVGTSPRVVGFALHKNPSLVIIPCHRVVGKNGHLTGYVNGIEKKRELLRKEGIRFVNKWQVGL